MVRWCIKRLAYDDILQIGTTQKSYFFGNSAVTRPKTQSRDIMDSSGLPLSMLGVQVNG